jgi:hypothetical protein
VTGFFAGGFFPKVFIGAFEEFASVGVDRFECRVQPLEVDFCVSFGVYGDMDRPRSKYLGGSVRKVMLENGVEC